MTTTEILNYINTADVGEINLMEVCGTHTMAIAKAGIKRVLPANVHLLSGPGCPVCVTPAEVIDSFLKLSLDSNIIITTYGDMLRVPGSEPGDNLARRKALGADVRIVYSPVDALSIAAENPNKEIVFLGVGFETTAPGTAIAIKLAAERDINNFSIYSMLKRTPPALRVLIADPEFNVQGFILPGHVAVITGENDFEFLCREHNIPAVISGFEPEDILQSIARLITQIKSGDAHIENQYTRLVRSQGNEAAKEAMSEFFEPASASWRGLGIIPDSGLAIKPQYKAHDAAKKFGIAIDSPKESICRCGEVIKGKLDPADCPLFGTACTPENPTGPCMVSSEGACAAVYKYGGI